jgi:hypothetical protein
VTGPDAEYVRLRAGFTKGIVACLAVMVGIGVLIHFANSGHHRPEGAAEHWLTAVGDTTRKGVKTDAKKRAEEIGPLTLAKPLLPTIDTDGKAAFPDLEVGKAEVTGDKARVPYRLHQRATSGDGPLKAGVLLLEKRDDRWHVTGLAARRADEKVPSEGGAPPSSAPVGVWIGGLAFGVLLTAGASLLVRWAERSAHRVSPSAA